MKNYELIVIGGGPAGLAAALAAWRNGLRQILVVERELTPGGILNQCIHNGFGLHHFGEELTGPEYAERFIIDVEKTGVEILCDTMVLSVSQNREVCLVNCKNGVQVFTANAVILAMGCRERTRGAIGIPGTRPAGVFTAGAAQRFLNIEGHMPGSRIVILGSGDIGLIMARRLTLEGAKVLACVELQPYSSGLTRNIVQCLQDFDIPLYLSHTIVEIQGEGRVSGVVIAEVGPDRIPIPGSEQYLSCDTVLLSVGLIPENELSRLAEIPMDNRTNGPLVYENRETMIPGIFACGNVLQVHDLVDYVTEESELAGSAAADYVLRNQEKDAEVSREIQNGSSISYVVPQFVRPANIDDHLEIYFRVRRPMGSSVITVTATGKRIARFTRDHVAPGEMERIRIPRILLEKAEGDLLVDIEEVSL